MIRAAIFDLDGLLIDSEPMWRRAEIEVLNPLGVPLSDEMCRQTQGTRVDTAVAHWFARYPWSSPPVEEVAARVVNRVIEIIREEGRAMPGAREAVGFFVERSIPVAVCSSSWSALIEAALSAIVLAEEFPIRVSAEDEQFGKPHPAVYLTTAAKLGTAATDCLVFEDSFYGAIAAKAALMKVVAVPEPFLRDPTRWGFCDAVLDSLCDFTPEVFAPLST